jgi:molybdopterin converting factor small subunit
MKLQEKKDQSTIELAEDHAMLAGMEKMKEEMMKNAVDSEAVLNYYGINDKKYYAIGNEEVDGEKYNLHDGDKVKLIIIKEDKV